MISDLVMKSRSARRFNGGHVIKKETLVFLADLGRLSPCAANRQVLKYYISWEKQLNDNIFQLLGWAAYLKDWNGPVENERPTGYIILLHDKDIHPACDIDHGIAAQSILLGARDIGLGGCIIATIKKNELRQLLSIPDKFEILLVLAIGKPVEKVVIEQLKIGGDIKYYRTPDGVHHVPKRSLEEVILNYK